MSQGGIYDHLGGGYARYSVDAIWLVPHFEKMLYDNAQLLELLALAHAADPDPLYAARAAETVDWLTREMTAGEGAFASSQDADSEGEEGRFYVWTKAEIDALLGPDAPAFHAAYDVTPEGNWEHKVILNRRARPELLPEAEEAALARCRSVLFEARSRRVWPGRDDKVLADWNGLAIAALVRAAAVFARLDWLALAERAFAFVATRMALPGDRLLHAWRDGRPGPEGLLEDYAAMARAALALHEATGEPAYLARAIAWANQADLHFAAPDGGYFTSPDDATDVLIRGRTAADNATPSGNGLLAEVQARLWHLTGEARWRLAAEATIGAFAGHRGLAAMPGLLAATDLLTDGITVVVAGAPRAADTQALIAAARVHPDPALVLLHAGPDPALPADHPASCKGPVGGRAAAFVCRGSACSLPVVEPAALAGALLRPTTRAA
jgi:uncharacterized protein YyaL (SSP411 family)